MDKQATTIYGATLQSIVEADIEKSSGLEVVAMVATSGSGKTATVIDLATKHFVIYCVCCSPGSTTSQGSTTSPEFSDPNFLILAKDVERIYRTIVDKGTLSPLDIDFMVKVLARERVQVEILGRLLFLQLLLQNNPYLEPWQFFCEQTSEAGTSIVQDLVNELHIYAAATIQNMLNNVEAKLSSLLCPRKKGLVIALDQAQAAANSILAGKLISSSALASYWSTVIPSVLFNDENEIHVHCRRGFLTPLTATLSHVRATLVILGTTISLQDAEDVYKAIAKPTNFTKITNFPHFNEDDVDKMLSDLVDISDCVIQPDKRRKLSGRPRFSLGIINRLIATGPPQEGKQAALDTVVDDTIKNAKFELQEKVRTILHADRTGESAQLLCRMVLAYDLQDPKISFSNNQQSDFVEKALCRLRPLPDGLRLVMDEPLVVEAVEEELSVWDREATFLTYMNQIHGIITNLGVKSSSKGNALGPLVCRSLQRFNGFRVVDLPFLQGIDLPEWCIDLELQIDEINTAHGFDHTKSGVAADLAFLTKCPPRKMLVPISETRPDGLWFFPDTRYAGSLGIKFFSDNVPQLDHEWNKTSTDIRACFLRADGSINKNLATFRRDFEASTT